MGKFRYFDESEFKCKCGNCTGGAMSKEFVHNLDYAREIAEVPFRITSGFRCKNHNRAVGGASSSSHMMGVAVDIAVDSSANRFKIANALMRAGITRLGIAEGFIHADIDENKKQDLIWTY